ncbi:MAG: Transcriptional regulatory protein WalR [Firmicutes bacterium]|nr:Transcriptional regulatory protein WalR [candidate division NPL-UPA2 bacterium]
MYKLLLVDDEVSFVKGITLSLEHEGYEVHTAYDGHEALLAFTRLAPDLIILDVMLPGLDGFAVCEAIRKKATVPIMMLTARSEDVDKVLGLEKGADDYLTKPFNTRELVARVRALLRRADWGGNLGEEPRISVRDLTIDTVKRKVSVKGRPVDLTNKEYDILLTLAANRGKIYSRENLLQLVWGYSHLGDLRNVDVHIRRLRGKIEEDPACPKYVLTRWGDGYYLRDNDHAD